jgi:hypothetical protein
MKQPPLGLRSIQKKPNTPKNTAAQTECQAALQIEKNCSIVEKTHRFDKKGHVLPQSPVIHN